MQAMRYPIVDRSKEVPVSVASAADFVLGPGQDFEAAELARAAQYSLYCLDFERQAALFVELPAEADLADAPFVYAAQYQQASSVVCVSLEAFTQLAASVPLPPNLTMLYSTGRCGSTLASRILAQVDAVWSISEPDALTNLALNRQTIEPGQMAGMIDAVLRFSCLPAALAGVQNVVIKPRSELVFLLREIAQARPDLRNLFMFRDAVGYANSMFRMVQRIEGKPDVLGTPEMKDRAVFFATANGTADGAAALMAARPEGMDGLDLIAMAWMLRMQAYERAVAAGIAVVPIEYGALNKDRRVETERLLAACGLDTGATDLAMAAFARDAHAGSQTGNAQAADDLTDAQRAQVAQLVADWQAQA